jgi:riboflavin kinase / FMN adenylyltransferase
MRIFRHLEEVPAGFGRTIASVGNFDGVHRAHQLVLKEVMRRAREENAKSVAVTFEPHPARVVRSDVAHKLITPAPLKLKLLEQAGLDAALVLPFTHDFSLTPPREFARTVLQEKLRAIEVHEGRNFHFGHKAEGNVDRLAKFGRDLGFKVKIYPELKIRGEVVSSSHIRELLRAGRVGRARQLLGRVFSVIGSAGRGRGQGHKYTVPTINLGPYEELLPGDGVYITRTRVGKELFDSVTNVGNRPTFGAEQFAVETHLLNFRPMELSNETAVEIFFLRRLRDEIKFPSVDALRAQIVRDVARAQRYFRLAPSAC